MNFNLYIYIINIIKMNIQYFAGYPISIIRYKRSVKVFKVYLSEVKITLKSKYIVQQELPTQNCLHKNAISTSVKHNVLANFE